MLLRVVVFAVVLSAAAACGGQALDGTCSADSGSVTGGSIIGGNVPTSWTCTTPIAPRVVTQCPAGVAQGGSCVDGVVDTTNPNMPAHYSGPNECFDCGGSTGTDWTCGPHGWEASGLYSCKP